MICKSLIPVFSVYMKFCSTQKLSSSTLLVVLIP